MKICYVVMYDFNGVDSFIESIKESYEKTEEKNYTSLEKHISNELVGDVLKEDNPIYQIICFMFLSLKISYDFAEKLNFLDVVGVNCFENVEDDYLQLLRNMAEDGYVQFIIKEKRYDSKNELTITIVPCDNNTKDEIRKKILIGEI